MTTAIVDWDAQSPQWLEILAVAAASAPSRIDTIWPLYRPLVDAHVHRRGFVLGQLGQSLDGRIATARGHSHYINGEAALRHLHRLRALVDAVVVGVGTVAADDPQLTVRRVAGPSPARVVIDPAMRAPDSARCFAADGARRVVVCREAGTRIPGVEYLVLPDLAPPAIVAALRAVGLARLLIEGGAKTLSGFVAHRALDRLHVMVAPLIIGDGPIGLNLPEIATLAEAHRPATVSYPMPEGDVLFDCAFDSGRG